MTKSGGGAICISVPPLQILGGGLVPLSPPVIYAHAFQSCNHRDINTNSSGFVRQFEGAGGIPQLQALVQLCILENVVFCHVFEIIIANLQTKSCITQDNGNISATLEGTLSMAQWNML